MTKYAFKRSMDELTDLLSLFGKKYIHMTIKHSLDAKANKRISVYIIEQRINTSNLHLFPMWSS